MQTNANLEFAQAPQLQSWKVSQTHVLYTKL